MKINPVELRSIFNDKSDAQTVIDSSVNFGETVVKKANIEENVDQLEIPSFEVTKEQDQVPTPGTVAYFKYMENHNWIEPVTEQLYIEAVNNWLEYIGTTYISNEDYQTFLSLLDPIEREKSRQRASEYGVDNVFLYYYMINDKLGNQMSFEEKFRYANQMRNVDRENNYILAHRTPISINKNISCDYSYFVEYSADKKTWYPFKFDSGYLQFFNEYGVKVTAPKDGFDALNPNDVKVISIPDKEHYYYQVAQYYSMIMDETLKYSPDYKEKSICSLKELNLIYANNAGYGGLTCSDITNINLNLLSVPKVDQLIDTFHHELGHEYAYSKYGDVSLNDEWLEIYNQINANDVSLVEGDTLLSPYAHSAPYECFAEVVTEYYNFNQTGEMYHNPNDLKALEIDYNGYTNLYDYITDLIGQSDYYNDFLSDPVYG